MEKVDSILWVYPIALVGGLATWKVCELIGQLAAWVGPQVCRG